MADTVEIEAIQFTGNNHSRIEEWSDWKILSIPDNMIGYWIVKLDYDEFIVVSNEVFMEKVYPNKVD